MENTIKNLLFTIDSKLDEMYMDIKDNDFTTKDKDIILMLMCIESTVSKIRRTLVEGEKDEL